MNSNNMFIYNNYLNNEKHIQNKLNTKKIEYFYYMFRGSFTV